MARLVAKLATRPRRTKLVWMVHDLRPHDGRWFKRLTWPSYAAVMARLADASLTLSEGTRAAVAAAYPALGRKPMEHLWHPAYPDEALTPAARTTARAGFGWTGDERVYGYCGQIRPYKGVEDLITAFMGLADQNARLLIAGRPQNAALAEALRSLSRERPAHPPCARRPDPRGVPKQPRRLRPRGRTLPRLSALGLDCACAERRSARAHARNSLRDQPRGRAWAPDWLQTYEGRSPPRRSPALRSPRRRSTSGRWRRKSPPGASGFLESLTGRPVRPRKPDNKKRPPAPRSRGAGGVKVPRTGSGSLRADLVLRVVPGLPGRGGRADLGILAPDDHVMEAVEAPTGCPP